AGELYGPGRGAKQRQRREAAPEVVERERVRRDVGVDAEYLTPRVEPHTPRQRARGALPIAVLERARELRVAQRPGERPGDGERAVESRRRGEPGDRAQMNAPRVHGERLESQAGRSLEVHFAFPKDAGCRPSRTQRGPEGPSGGR